MSQEPSAISDGTLEHKDAGAFQRLGEVFTTFLKLGCSSFGGPVAHLGYFRNEFVERRRWLDDSAFADLIGLCQFLPGPASSQAVFALGMMRAGLPGALVASLCFTLPSALMMIAFAYGVAAAGDLHAAGWLHGLKLAAAAVVAQAVLGMARNLCPDLARKLVALLAAGVLVAFQAAWVQIAVLAAGALLGGVIFRASAVSILAQPAQRHSHFFAAAALLFCALLLALLPVLAANYDSKHLKAADSFYRSGALVFGGGHVVLPLLRAEVVPKGWISDDQFLAGYGAAQAVPGPLFTFSAYLGTAIFPGPHAWLGGFLCLFAVFLPAWLLIAGALPFWHALRAKPWAQAALKGANAAVVGMLLAAFYRPVLTESVDRASDVIAILIAFALLQYGKVSPIIAVVLMAAAGQWLL